MGKRSQKTDYRRLYYCIYSFFREGNCHELMTRYPTMGELILESPFIATDRVFRCYEVHPRGQDARNT